MFGQGSAMDEVIRTEMHPIIDEIAAEQGFEVIDLWEPTQDMEEYFPDGCHPNHQGAYVIAKAIYKGITGKVFDEAAMAPFIPEPKVPYCIVNKANGKVLEMTPYQSAYRAETNDFVKDNEAQQFLFENFSYDVFRIKTSIKNSNNDPCYLALKTGYVVPMEIGYNWGNSDNLLSVQITPKENGYYTMGVWKVNSYMGAGRTSTVVQAGKKLASLSDLDEWAFVKASDMQVSAIESIKSAAYTVVVENGNTVSVKDMAPSTKILLHNVFGQTVYSAVAGGSQVSIPASKGFFILTFDEGKSKTIRKILVQ